VNALTRTVAVIGGGPAGLMAAEVLSKAGIHVELFDAMPSVGRKFLLAGKGGLNLTHSEPLEPFLARYGAGRARIEPLLAVFGPIELQAWAHGLGIDTFVGTSGRVFPTEKKAAPLLRAWLRRLRATGVHLNMRHRWIGWSDEGALCFATPDVDRHVKADAAVLALGGGSWARLGSDGAWVPLLEAQGIAITPLRPANCGFDVAWSTHLRERFAGEPLKSVRLRFGEQNRRGEFVVTEHGVEGGVIYAFSAALRDSIELNGKAIIHVDLLPDWSPERVLAEVSHPRGARSLSSHLQSRLGLKGVKTALLRECLSPEQMHEPPHLAAAIKSVPIELIAARPIDEAISSAGGVKFTALDAGLMLSQHPGVFCAGEMLDWEAPTGGYLLTACLASGFVAGQACRDWLNARRTSSPIRH
jgi:uncharacterized flavoprotein (TIGR03862 family)